jgi:hypothetical protein
MSVSKSRIHAQKLASSARCLQVCGFQYARRKEHRLRLRTQPVGIPFSGFVVTNQAEQIAENKDTLENLTTNEPKNEPKNPRN